MSTELIADHTHGLVALGRSHPLATPVPTCGDWNLADLVWHLTEVQEFWGHIIAGRPDASPASYDRPVRPDDDGVLADRLAAATDRLVSLLDTASPTESAWTWSEGDQSVGFTIRRQTHEAIVHHLDGVLAVGNSPAGVSIDPEVAADGIDELITVMLIDVPAWAEYHPSPDTVRLDVSDLGRHWDLEFGRMTGTSPDTGTIYDIVAFDGRDDIDEPDTTIAGTALDLLLWLWGRTSADPLTIAGEPTAPGRLRDAIVDATD